MSDPSNAQTTHNPFEDGLWGHLEAFMAATKIRCQRISLENRLAEAQGGKSPPPDYMSDDDTDNEDDLQQQVTDLRTQEKDAFATFAAREAAHRATPVRGPLPINTVCQEADLNEQERFILLALTIPCFGEELAKAVYDPLDRIYYRGLTVEALVALLDPANLKARLDARKLFHSDAPLVNSGLIHIECGHGAVQPEDLWDARVYLTWAGFARVLGDQAVIDSAWVQSERATPTAAERGDQ